jgi:hypothetical protein
VAGRQGVLFLKKKNQKNFCSLCTRAYPGRVQMEKSFFGSFFSKKELLASCEAAA